MALDGAEGEPREAMECDVVVVGAGPAGLATAIRLKQLAASTGAELSVIVLEKGSEVGAHILSGAVIDPIGLNTLIPDWQEKGAPVDTPVTEDRFYYLGPSGALRIPNLIMPPLMSNHGNYVVSLGNLVRWLGEQATGLGVDIYPEFAASEVLYDEAGAVAGVATGDKGIGKDGKPTDRFQRGIELRAKYTVIAEGARGSLAKTLVPRFGLEKGREPQKYGLGLKELWEVQPEKHRPGLVQTTRTPTSRPTASSSASRRTPPSATPSRAAGASATARAPSPRVDGSRSRSWPSPAVCWWVARQGS
jgi:electron-transferring-flavoprotein dehydrogenase